MSETKHRIAQLRKRRDWLQKQLRRFVGHSRACGLSEELRRVEWQIDREYRRLHDEYQHRKSIA